MLEFSLYVADVGRAADFYHHLFGFPVLISKERIAALDVEGKQILLLFKHGASSEPVDMPGGLLPGHDGEGTSHVAFAVQESDVDRWEEWLREQGVEIESEVQSRHRSHRYPRTRRSYQSHQGLCPPPSPRRLRAPTTRLSR